VFAKNERGEEQVEEVIEKKMADNLFLDRHM